MARVSDYILEICEDHKAGLTNEEIAEKNMYITAEEVQCVLDQWYDIMMEED